MWSRINYVFFWTIASVIFLQYNCSSDIPPTHLLQPTSFWHNVYCIVHIPLIFPSAGISALRIDESRFI
ncbi:hypothetical protein B0H16DRAFT_1549894 [Mycena metata]|uniref:Uncharacterized protein n=1 Tax=Mycena metata TaxID=1033252 RepID=A0AAD7N9E1_9AGAR|nr:hypothetical protein B0H16DRAFT_1549894 [Mycena metata]